VLVVVARRSAQPAAGLAGAGVGWAAGGCVGAGAGVVACPQADTNIETTSNVKTSV